MVNMEIFYAFFWALMAADAVFFVIAFVVVVAWKAHQRKARRKWRGEA